MEYNSLGHDALSAEQPQRVCQAPVRRRCSPSGRVGALCVEIGLIGHAKWAGQILQHGSRIFIAPDDGSSDVFVHVHDVEAAGMKILVAGQLVTYEIGLARDGRSKAVKLRVPNP